MVRLRIAPNRSYGGRQEVMSSSETAESSQLNMRFLYKDQLRNDINLFSKTIFYCEYYCDLFIIVSVFYSLTLAEASLHEEQHSDETRLSAQGHRRNMWM